MSARRYTDWLEVEVLSVGPEVRLGETRLGPDEVIALEGVGTFESVSVKARAERLVKKGKDLKSYSKMVHRESTRRGHASLTTSMVIFYEVRDCSRLLSMLLVAPQFGSYLQESQRRSFLSPQRLLIPAELRKSELGDRYEALMDECYEAYKKLTELGIEIEDARYLLPLSSATSLYSAISFEAYIYLLTRIREGGKGVPAEVSRWGELFSSKVSEHSPLLLESRLSFGGRHNYYPWPDPTRPPDGLMDRLAGSAMGEEVTLVSLDAADAVREALESGDWTFIDALNPLVKATTVESLSLVAYHQAIRHRTVPTVVESLHDAASRALKRPREAFVIPPSLKRDEGALRLFDDVCNSLLEMYRFLMDEGEPAAALYALPQSLRIYVLRSYNLFNLLYPAGFIATRTCSYAQWEERAIAYKIWREVGKRAPWLSSRMGEKCRQLGYCPERDWCPIILRYMEYSDEVHKSHNQ